MARGSAWRRPPTSNAGAVLRQGEHLQSLFPRVGRFFGFEAAHLAPVPTGGYEARFVEPLDDEYPPDRTFDIGCVWNGEFVLTSLVLPP